MYHFFVYVKINSCNEWKNKEAVMPHKNIYLPLYLEIQARLPYLFKIEWL